MANLNYNHQTFLSSSQTPPILNFKTNFKLLKIFLNFSPAYVAPHLLLTQRLPSIILIRLLDSDDDDYYSGDDDDDDSDDDDDVDSDDDDHVGIGSCKQEPAFLAESTCKNPLRQCYCRYTCLYFNFVTSYHYLII